MLRMLERGHVYVLEILYVDDADYYRASLRRQRKDALDFIAGSDGRATLRTTFDPFRSDTPGFPTLAVD